MRWFLLFIVVATLPYNASAQNTQEYWYIGMSGNGGAGETITFIDASRVQVTGNTRRAWIEGYMTGAARAARGIRHMRNLNEYDCEQRRTRNIQLTAYFVDTAQAPFTTPGDMLWSYSVPDTAGEWALDFVCGSRAERYVRVPSNLSPAEAAERLFGVVQGRE